MKTAAPVKVLLRPSLIGSAPAPSGARVKAATAQSGERAAFVRMLAMASLSCFAPRFPGSRRAGETSRRDSFVCDICIMLLDDIPISITIYNAHGIERPH